MTKAAFGDDVHVKRCPDKLPLALKGLRAERLRFLCDVYKLIDLTKAKLISLLVKARKLLYRHTLLIEAYHETLSLDETPNPTCGG